MDLDLRNIDCLELLKEIPDKSIDLIIQDTPYGTTELEWDLAPNFADMWPQWERVIKDNGAILFTAVQPFVTDIINSNRKLFRYEIIWEKTQPSRFLDANKRPLLSHENILVFYKKQPTYNPQKYHEGSSTLRKGKKAFRSGHYSRFLDKEETGTDDGMRFPITVINFSNWNGAIFGNTKTAVSHPTQKPVDLFRYLIKTYTNEGMTVFDGYSGSGTTAIACLKEKRKFIGAELKEDYYINSIKRIENEKLQPVLF